MSENVFHRAIYLTGPTASGKTAVGVALLRRLDAEVVALDSMTLYRGMDIATAKPTLAERGGVPHHLIDVIDPWESASVSAYREWAAQGSRRDRGAGQTGSLRRWYAAVSESAAAAACSRGQAPITSSASGSNAKPSSTATPHFTSGWPHSTRKTAARLHPHDRRRVVRALEVFELTGRPISELQAEHDRPAPPAFPSSPSTSPARACTTASIAAWSSSSMGAGRRSRPLASRRPDRSVMWPRRRSAIAR